MTDRTLMNSVDLSLIRVNGGTQSRAAINSEVVSEYAEALSGGAEFPPVVLFFDGSDYWLADGFHRLDAYRGAGRVEIPADVRQGTQRDAILFSVGANASHGLRRTNDDKRRAVLTLLNDAEWGAWSDREIARACSVSPDTVGRCRKSGVVTVRSDSEKRTYTTKHGTTATMDTSAIGKSELPPPAPAPSLEEIAASVEETVREFVGTVTGLPEGELAKARRDYERLTPEALVEEMVGLIADLADAKREAAALRAERDDLRAKLKEALQGDLGRALGNAQRRADAATGRMNEYMAAAKRLEFRLKKAEARVQELESAPITMGAS